MMHVDFRKPEDFRADKARPFTGEEYLETLRHGREVYIDGERVHDITTHPAFRNAARSIARLYDALHDPAKKDILTCPTDTGNGGYTFRSFRIARSIEDLQMQQKAIAEWSRLSYGWMGRTPDYKAALMNTLGVNAEWYGDFADNARAWYKRAQESVLFMNHAIVNPPVDRAQPVASVRDVFITIQKEDENGIYVSGAKVVATSAALTHYNFIGQAGAGASDDTDMAVSFILPMSAPGCKLFCRTSYEKIAHLAGTPFDYPLSSRFDENDAIFVLDNVFVPWENVLIYRDPERLKRFQPTSGFLNGYCFQGCTRLAVKLDFLTGLTARALHTTGADTFRGNQALLGEIVGYRNLIWTLSNTMANVPVDFVGGAKLPNLEAALCYRTFAGDSYGRIKEIIEKIIASALIYLPSSANDFKNPEIDKYLQRYVRGSYGIDHIERIKVMKLLWDAIGSEFGGRHELYERNYSGNHEDVRLHQLQFAERTGTMAEMQALVEQCLSDYNENGWTGSDWVN
ncbi:4-hydroxyphenylacetate 3-hydroxylase N-terminal domain-containing protein [Daeguia caeni]|uniref:4-hydroxyphenylacetate 3-hydroxylase N-terminal domain-containing protein n=1 Tax=Daeguia caeni TaxID=439612 RepID=A0ABV9H740_9HYPH